MGVHGDGDYLTVDSKVEVVQRAAAAARKLLAGDRARLAHTESVAGRAQVLAVGLAPADQTLRVAAAWLHDIGYSPTLAGDHIVRRHAAYAGLAVSRDAMAAAPSWPALLRALAVLAVARMPARRQQPVGSAAWSSPQ